MIAERESQNRSQKGLVGVRSSRAAAKKRQSAGQNRRVRLRKKCRSRTAECQKYRPDSIHPLILDLAAILDRTIFLALDGWELRGSCVTRKGYRFARLELSLRSQTQVI